MKSHFTGAELASRQIAGLPRIKNGVNGRAAREHRTSRPHAGRGGGVEYPITCLPAAARDELLRRVTVGTVSAAPPADRRLSESDVAALAELGAALLRQQAATREVSAARAAHPQAILDLYAGGA